MHCKRLKRWRWTAIVLGAVLLGSSASGAGAQTLAKTVMKSEAATPIQAPSRDSATGNVETYQDIPVGFTADGYPFRGDPNAPLTLVEYSDFLCPFCELYFRQTLPTLLEKYVKTGQVKFVVHDFPLASLHPNAPKGATAAMCAAEQGAARFWQMHDALLQNQQQWSRLPDPASYLADAARNIGVDMSAYRECVASGRNDARLQQRLAAGQALGFTGTPSFQFISQKNEKTYTLVGAQPVDLFNRWIDGLLVGKEPSEAQPAQKPALPLWAKPEGLVPDPKRPGFTVAGDPYKGNPNAKLVLIEFGDFQCPACQQHAVATQPTLDKQFVETGEVMWVVKHFPLRMHPRAPLAAAAAVCAGEQGAFWPMHHLLFERMEQWSTSRDPDATLGRLAAGIKLDKIRFTACLTGRKAMERVLRDVYDGQAINVRNLPAFILFHGGTGHVLVGARSAEEFTSTLRQQIARAKTQLSAESATVKR